MKLLGWINYTFKLEQTRDDLLDELVRWRSVFNEISDKDKESKKGFEKVDALIQKAKQQQKEKEPK